MNSTTTAAPATIRFAPLTSMLLLTTAGTHVPVTWHHRAESYVLGWAFAAFTVACVALAVAVALRPGAVTYAAVALLSGAAVVAYAATRAFVVPGFEHDVGLWLDPAGVMSVAAEASAAFIALRLLRA